MISIQDVGIQILEDNPGKFYVFGGCEYGIKEKYISILKEQYGKQIEATSVKEVVEMLSKKHLIPLEPAVYVIRYDEVFDSEISDSLASKIHKLKFPGTVVCIYESLKHINKIDKYLPDCVVSIDSVSPQFISKYLHTDFPNLDDRLIEIAVKHADNYNQARNVCRSMSYVDSSFLDSMSEDTIAGFFGCSDMSTETQIRLAVAGRQFSTLIDLLDKYGEDTDRIFYAILQTMIELDKVLDNSRIQSDIKQFARNWTREDIYYMFMNTYLELKKSRSGSSYDIKLSMIYLFGLIKFQRIPSPEVMNS